MTNMVETHVRFKPESYELIKQLADAQHMSVANLIRSLVEANMSKYMSSVRYVDKEQGDEILQAVNTLINETVRTRNELNRIGVNINQHVKNCYGYRSSTKIIDYAQTLQQMSMQSDKNAVPEELKQVAQIIADFSATVQKESEELCRIRG